MREWVSSLMAGRVPELAVALAFGYALALLAENVARIPVSALAQNVGRNPFGTDDALFGPVDYLTPYYLNVSVGSTVFAYGPTLVTVLAMALLGLVALVVVRHRDRVLGECPFCASRIPHESRHCAFCGSSVPEGS